KDVMAMMRLLVDTDDDLAIARIANAPPRGLSARVLESGRRRAAQQGSGLWTAIRAQAAEGTLPPAAAAGVAEIDQAISGARAAAMRGNALQPSEALVSMLASLRYRTHLEHQYPDANECQDRLACVEELVNGLARSSRRASGGSRAGNIDPLGASINAFLDDLVLDVQQAERFREDRSRGEAVKLMTLHAAKGLEFDAVWMVGMEENILPHHRAVCDDAAGVDEERRLCSVGVTRARTRLTLSLCLTRLKWGKPRRGLPSRFLYELTGQPERFAERAEESDPSRDRPNVRNGRQAKSAGHGRRRPAR
ncbi:MAG: 3'-5' exonuclease, partial [Planctomycetaceae bacterium]